MILIACLELEGSWSTPNSNCQHGRQGDRSIKVVHVESLPAIFASALRQNTSDFRHSLPSRHSRRTPKNNLNRKAPSRINSQLAQPTFYKTTTWAALHTGKMTTAPPRPSALQENNPFMIRITLLRSGEKSRCSVDKETPRDE